MSEFTEAERLEGGNQESWGGFPYLKQARFDDPIIIPEHQQQMEELGLYGEKLSVENMISIWGSEDYPPVFRDRALLKALKRPQGEEAELYKSWSHPMEVYEQIAAQPDGPDKFLLWVEELAQYSQEQAAHKTIIPAGKTIKNISIWLYDSELIDESRFENLLEKLDLESQAVDEYCYDDRFGVRSYENPDRFPLLSDILAVNKASGEPLRGGLSRQWAVNKFNQWTEARFDDTPESLPDWLGKATEQQASQLLSQLFDQVRKAAQTDGLLDFNPEDLQRPLEYLGWDGLGLSGYDRFNWSLSIMMAQRDGCKAMSLNLIDHLLEKARQERGLRAQKGWVPQPSKPIIDALRQIAAEENDESLLTGLEEAESFREGVMAEWEAYDIVFQSKRAKVLSSSDPRYEEVLNALFASQKQS